MKLTLIGAAAALAVVSACSRENAGDGAIPKVPLYDNLGSLHHPITTSSPDAQRYFDQGLRLSYAFNHAEAIRAFRHAAAIDQDCAMCYWGVAFALGPNINAAITEDAAKEAYAAIEGARSRGGKASAKEQAYIAALAKRYAADPKAERASLDAAYAVAMGELAKLYPDDLDALTLFAQSLMDTSPWNYWNGDGSPRPLTNDVLTALESVLTRKNDHIGAIHLYIHAVEASPNPKRAEQYADRLPSLAPGAGHLVHMPAHVYLRVGRFNDASVANEDALKADEAYFAGDRVAGNMMYEVGYYPHNTHFFVTTASMEGRSGSALQAAEEVRKKMHMDMLRDPGMGGMVQHMHLSPLFTKTRFARWDAVLAEPAPASDLPYMRAVAHALRGLALAADGRLDEAEQERRAVLALKDDASLKTMYVSSVNTAATVAAIAYEVLSGELRARQRRAGDAAKHFAAAVALEDSLIYMEPPDWPIPVRQLQGAALLALGRAKEAESAFRADLIKFPNNGWSLSGLHASLEQQRRTPEAATIKTQLDQAWQRADVKLAAGRVER
jgi:tetratricopeptide (TPR) repeat protein